MTARCPTCGRKPAGRPGKLTEDDVRAIRASTVNGEALSAQYGLTRGQISQIKHRKSYTWVSDE